MKYKINPWRFFIFLVVVATIGVTLWTARPEFVPSPQMRFIQLWKFPESCG